MNQIPNIEDVVEQFMMTWFRPAYFEALTPTNRQEQVIYDEAKLKWETCKQQLTETLHHQLQKAREEERGRAIEIIKDELRTAPLEVQMTKGIVFANIIGRIQSELDQPTNITSE